MARKLGLSETAFVREDVNKEEEGNILTSSGFHLRVKWVCAGTRVWLLRRALSVMF